MKKKLHTILAALQPHLAWILVCILWVVAGFRIQTYVSGQDSVTYMRLARILLAEPIGSPPFLAALTEVAPGYPLILAAAIKLGGRFAPHWINLGFALGFLVAYAALLRLLLRDRLAEALTLVLTSAILLCGYSLNPHFLLYPFRGMPAYFFACLGLLLVVRSGTVGGRPIHAIGGGLAFLCAILIREPMVFVAAGGAAWLLARPRDRATWSRALAFSAPFLFCAVAAGILLLVRGGTWTTQLSGWAFMVRSSAEGGLLPHMGQMASGLCEYLLDEVSWAGIILLAIGVWRLPQWRDGWWLFLLPAILLAGFYMLFPFPHRRYFISILLFLCPVMSLGFCFLLDQATRSAGTRRRRTTGYLAAIGLIGLPLTLHVFQLQTWMAFKVERQDVLAFYDDLYGFASPGDLLVIDPACRYLWDALESYERFRIHTGPEQIDQYLQDGARGLYLQPLNAEATFSQTMGGHQVRSRQRLRARFDLRPVAGPHLSIAGGEFRVFEIVPWTHTSVRQPVRNVRGKDMVVWVDLQSLPPDAPVRIGLAGDTVSTSWPIVGGGIHALVWPAASNTSHRLIFTAESTVPLPSSPVVDVVPANRTVDFTFMPERSLSVRSWFQPPFRLKRNPIRGRYAAAITHGGRLCLPTVHGNAGRVDIMLLMSPSPVREEQVALSYEVNGTSIGGTRMSLARERSHIGFSVPLAAGAPTPCVDIQVDPAGCHGSHLRPHFARIKVTPTTPSPALPSTQ